MRKFFSLVYYSVRNEQAGLPRLALLLVGGGVEATSAEFRIFDD